MEFILYCIDKPDRARVRLETRTAHLEYVSGRQDIFHYGGPLIDEQGVTKGSLMIVRLPDRAALEQHLRGDPFFGADLFASVTIWSSRQVIPETAPGLLRAEIARQAQLAAPPAE